MAKTTKAATKTAPKAKTAAKTAAPVEAPVAPERPSVATRACPTRIDGLDPLFQHRVTVAQCSTKQRSQYHKCFTCSYGCNGDAC